MMPNHHKKLAGLTQANIKARTDQLQQIPTDESHPTNRNGERRAQFHRDQTTCTLEIRELIGSSRKEHKHGGELDPIERKRRRQSRKPDRTGEMGK